MPQFRWRGVTRDGKWRSGRSSALSREQLESRMLQRGVAVTKVVPVRSYYLWYTVPRIMQAQSLDTIALLIEAGMPISEACLITAETTENVVLQEAWIQMAAAIERGAGITDQSSLSRIFGPFIAHLLVVGYRAGTFSVTARISAHYARASHELTGKLRSALAMPLITLLFVFGLLWLIFAFLVPSLTNLFTQFNAAIPWSTQLLLTISGIVQNPWFFVGMACMFLGCIGFYYVFKYHGWGSAVLARTPGIGTLCAQWQRILFVQALSALLQGGMSLAEALDAIAERMPSAAVRNYATQLAYAVAGGVTLSDAIAVAETSLSTPLMVAMVRVGQESNKLALVLNTFAERESVQFLARLQRLTLMLQPTLIILLGFIVLAVIGAIYMPLINIAHVVQ
jgi:type II secretory pathway component PulF